jgi:hypothetical protein
MIKKTLLWIGIAIAVRFGFLACAPASPALEAKRAVVTSCIDNLEVKKCTDQIMTVCFGESVMSDEDMCVTRATARAIADCFKLCDPPDSGASAAAP